MDYHKNLQLLGESKGQSPNHKIIIIIIINECIPPGLEGEICGSDFRPITCQKIYMRNKELVIGCYIQLPKNLKFGQFCTENLWMDF